MRAVAFSMITLVVLAGCAGAPDMGQNPQASNAAGKPTEVPTTGIRAKRQSQHLYFSGQGNSGGVIATSGEAPKAGLEATVTRGSTPPPGTTMYYSEGYTIDFHNGPLTGVQVSCGTGRAMNSYICTAGNAREAQMVKQHAGKYGYVAMVSVSGFGAGERENAIALVHTEIPQAMGPAPTLPSLIPNATASYNGRMQAGLTYSDGETTFSDTIDGFGEIFANFATGTLSGEFASSVPRGFQGQGDGNIEVVTGFENAFMAGDGTFYTGAGTTFSFGGRAASGVVEGGIYGPMGDEVIGGMAIRNEFGGVNGIFSGHAASTPTNQAGLCPS